VSATRGLATVALLKVNFDAGRDHLGMFEPFVLDAWVALGGDGVSVEDVRAAVLERHQLTLPQNLVRTLLGRVQKQGYARREGGRYFKTDKQPNVADLTAARERVEERQELLAEVLCRAAAERGVAIRSTEDALALIMKFLEQYHVSLALGEADAAEAEPTDPADEPDGSRATVVTAEFLAAAVAGGGELADVVQETLEGYVLQNALLLKDISTAARRFKNLHVVCDSLVLLGALGLRGEATETATKELLALLRATGCVLDVFEPTISEMRRILTVYEERIGTHEGRLSLYPTDLTRYLVTNHYSPSDVRGASSLIEQNLKGLGLNIRETPAHRAEYTLDEQELAAMLAGREGSESDSRVVHDVDCVAGVLTYRRGVTSSSLDEARAVFLTSSGVTAKTVRDWYRAQGGRGVPPIIHYLFLSNIAWLKRPASATRLKLHELVALCSAALRPSRAGWDRFLAHLRRLQKSGVLSSDEVTAIIAADLTDRTLAEEEVGDETDAATLSEVVERVKASYRKQADADVERAEKAARRSDESAQRSNAEALQVRLHVGSRARGVAKTCCWALSIVVGGAFVAGTIVTILDIASGSSPGVLGVLVAAVLAVGGLMSLLWGFHINRYRTWLEDWLTDRLSLWLGGRDDVGSGRPDQTS